MDNEKEIERLREIGRKGGLARAVKLSKAERSRIALKAVWIREYLKELKKKQT